MIDLKDLRPAFLRLLPAFRKQAVKLQQMRASLQKEVRRVVKAYGPELGPLYYEKSYNWEQMLRKSGIAGHGILDKEDVLVEPTEHGDAKKYN